MTKGSFCNGNSTEPCPIGYYRDLEGGMTVDDCFKCPAGKYCNSLGLDKSVENLDLCPKGYYCDGYDVSTDSTMKKPCGEHHYCPEGSYKPTLCSDGQYQTSTVAESCLDCEAGSKCFAFEDTIKIEDCDPGYYCGPKTGRLGKPCPPGTYLETSNGKVEEDCVPCEPGHYCNRFGLSEMSGECEEGFYCEQRARSGTPPTGSGYGGPCTPGHMCTAGSTQETKCLRGTHQPNYYGTECLTCPAGQV